VKGEVHGVVAGRGEPPAAWFTAKDTIVSHRRSGNPSAARAIDSASTATAWTAGFSTMWMASSNWNGTVNVFQYAAPDAAARERTHRKTRGDEIDPRRGVPLALRASGGSAAGGDRCHLAQGAIIARRGC